MNKILVRALNQGKKEYEWVSVNQSGSESTCYYTQVAKDEAMKFSHGIFF